MRQKWGFYKFPLDPVRCAPLTVEELAWRDIPTHATILNEDNVNSYLRSDTHVGLGFDLTLPLRQPFEDARKMLAILQRQLARNTPENICTVNHLRQQWTLYLRIVDGLSCEQAPTVARQLHSEDIGIDFEFTLQQARQLLERGISAYFENPGSIKRTSSHSNILSKIM